MKMRRLGSQGLSVAEIGLGCMSMSEFYGPADETQSIATLHRAVELGVTMFDTADVYGSGENEKLVGRALRGMRDRVVIATKFGILRKKEDPKYRGICGRPEYVRQGCDASLKRLGIECIDLYYIHRVDGEVPIEDTVGVMADLVRQGKVRFLGISEAGAATIRRAHAVHPLSAVQSEYSLWTRDPEEALLPALRELGIGFVPYSPLGRGMFSGAIRSQDDFAPEDFRRNLPRFQDENFRRNLLLVEKLKAIALRKDCTPSQLALAWVLAQGDDVVPIPGTTRRRHLEENLASTSLALTAQERLEIESVMPMGAAAGNRYADMAFVNREAPPRY
jgi:aryl-alcohol dehydrogenase-like predicted oxidoreductase